MLASATRLNTVQKCGTSPAAKQQESDGKPSFSGLWVWVLFWHHYPSAACGEWHSLIVEGAGNAVIDELLQRLNVPIHRLLFDSFYDVERLRTANDDHRRILRAILARDAAAAEEAMRAHVQAGFEMLSAIETEYQI